MLRWIQKHYIVSFLLLLIFVLCALHLNGTRNEERILPKQGLIIEKDITVDINRNPTAELKILNAANYSESYTLDVLPILKQYNCYIVDYMIVNEELYLLGCSNDTIPDMKLHPLLIFKITDTSLVSNVIGYDLDKFSASLDYVDGKIIASNRDGKYIIDTNLSASKIVNTDQGSVRQEKKNKHGIQKDKVISDSLIPRDLYINGKVGDTYLLTVTPLIYAKPNMNLPFDFFKATHFYGIPIYENNMLFWNANTDEMEAYSNLKDVTSFHIKYMDMNYDIDRFKRWNQVIKNSSVEK
ncbi:MAG: hypothetical protein E6Y16_07375 [Veillonella sp.]|mgnify:CR=1 FL=1|jgi:hypothetical protein|uniref:hypothetical protein n=1 Tax=Veillonella sp. TaxID=1926307 RepID=UPI0029131AE4|nr:hypothetical protein [Veillonella sp.]MDU3433771.1 hypothetical protein [Veillonella sp.]MDU4712923.1 hypothetical protein [Veillonella sp.]